MYCGIHVVYVTFPPLDIHTSFWEVRKMQYSYPSSPLTTSLGTEFETSTVDYVLSALSSYSQEPKHKAASLTTWS